MRHFLTKQHNLQSGFTLVQMSVLVTILGLATAAAIPGGKQGQPIERQLTTEDSLDHVQKAMMGYKTMKGALPCPADARLAPTDPNFGIAALNDGTCVGATPAASLTGSTAVVGGMIPVRTLGIEDKYAYDGFGRRFTYVVDSRATSSSSCISISQSTSAIQVKDSSGVVTSTYAAYISHGASGYGAYPANGGATPLYPSAAAAAILDAGKIDNASVLNTGVPSFDAVFVKKEKSGSFDDLVRTENTCCIGSLCSTPKYDGPEAAMTVTGCSNPNPNTTYNSLQIFEKTNGQLTGILPKLPAIFTVTDSFTFSPDNDFLIVTSRVLAGPANYDFTVLKRTGKTYSVTQNRLINGAFTHTATYGAPVPKFSPDSKYMFIFTFNPSKPLAVYIRNGDIFTLVSDPFWNNITYLDSMSWSKATNEVSIKGYGPVWGYFDRTYKYNASSNTYTLIANESGSLSPDGNYMISNTRYPLILTLKKRRPNTNIFDVKETKVTTGLEFNNFYEIAWSPDSKYIAVPSIWGTNAFEVYKILPNDTLLRITNFDGIPFTDTPNRMNSVGWSADGDYLAFAQPDYTCRSTAAFYYRKYGDNFYLQPRLELGTNPQNGLYEGYAHAWYIYFRN